MSDPAPFKQKPTMWFLIIVILTAFPALKLPALISASNGEAKVLLWLYPAMLLLGCWCALQCYRQRRMAMTWILIVVCWLMTVSINVII